MPDPRKQYLVGVRAPAGTRGSPADPAPLKDFLAEMDGLEGAMPRPMRDPNYAVVQLTDAEAESLREKYRDSLLIEPDAPLQY